jgi:hypothetical protein
VVLRRLYLALAIACGLCGVFGDVAALPLVDATIDVSCDLLVALLTPLLAGLGALLGTMDIDTDQCFPAADWGWSKSHHLGIDGLMGGDAAPSFGGALGGIGQCVEGSRKCSAMCADTAHPSQHPPRVTARAPLSTGLIVAQVPCTSFRSSTYLTVLPMCQGLSLWAWMSQRN